MGGSTTPIAPPPSADNQWAELLEKTIADPKLIQSLLKTDFNTAIALLAGFNTLQIVKLVKTLHAKDIFDWLELVEGSYDYTKLTTSNVTLPKEKYDAETVRLPSRTSEPALWEKAIQMLLDSGLRRSERGIGSFKSITYEYCIFEEEKTKSLKIFEGNSNSGNDPRHDPTFSYDHESAIRAYDAHLKRQYIQKNLPGALANFFRSWGTIYNLNVDSIIGPILESLTKVLIKNKHWSLLTELFLRLKFDLKSDIFEKMFIADSSPLHLAFSATPEDSNDYKRFMKMICEIIRHHYRTSVYARARKLSGNSTDIDPSKVAKNTNLFKKALLYNRNEPYLQIAYKTEVKEHLTFPLFTTKDALSEIIVTGKDELTTINAECNTVDGFEHYGRIDAQVIFTQYDLAKKSAINKKNFFDKLFSDIFPCWTLPSFTWISQLDLTDEINKSDTDIFDTINKILGWGIVSPIAYLSVPLNEGAFIKLFKRISLHSWKTIGELFGARPSGGIFDEIAHFLNELTRRLQSLDVKLGDGNFAQLAQNEVKQFILTLLALGQIENAHKLYVKFHACYQGQESADFREQIRIKTEEDIVSRFRAEREAEKYNIGTLQTDHKTNVDAGPEPIKLIFDHFIAHPQRFIDLLCSDFILAQKYFCAMSDADVAGLLKAAPNLPEMIIKIFALNDFEKKQVEINIPYLREDHSFKDEFTVLLNKANLIHIKGFSFAYLEIKVYSSEKSWFTASEKVGNYVGNRVEISSKNYFVKVFNHYKHDCYLREAGRRMLAKLMANFQPDESIAFDWGKNDILINAIFLGLMFRGSDELLFRILKNKSAVVYSLALLYLSKDGDKQKVFSWHFAEFKKWFYSPYKKFYALRTLFHARGPEDIIGILNLIEPFELKTIIRHIISHNDADGLLLDILKYLQRLILTGGEFHFAQMISVLDDKEILEQLYKRSGGIYAVALCSLYPDHFSKPSFWQFNNKVQSLLNEDKNLGQNLKLELENDRKLFEAETRQQKKGKDYVGSSRKTNEDYEHEEEESVLLIRIGSLEQQLKVQQHMLNEILTLLQQSQCAPVIKPNAPSAPAWEQYQQVNYDHIDLEIKLALAEYQASNLSVDELIRVKDSAIERGYPQHSPHFIHLNRIIGLQHDAPNYRA